MSQPCSRAHGPGPCGSEALPPVQPHRCTATLTLPRRTAWKHCAWRTVLATVVTAIPVLMRHCLGSYGYAFPQTLQKQAIRPWTDTMLSFQPPLGHPRPQMQQVPNPDREANCIRIHPFMIRLDFFDTQEERQKLDFIANWESVPARRSIQCLNTLIGFMIFRMS
jgi:hypothetical protein